MSTIDPNHSHLTITPTRPNEDTALGLRSNFAPSAFRIIPFSRLLVGFSLLLACLFTAAPVAAQVAGYNFDSNIEDQVGDNGATYLIANMTG